MYIALDVDGNLLIGDHGGIEEDIELLHKNGLIKKTKQHPQYFLEDQKLFWSGIEILLYLMKHSRVDIASAVRELLKVMDGANHAAFLEMHY